MAPHPLCKSFFITIMLSFTGLFSIPFTLDIATCKGMAPLVCVDVLGLRCGLVSCLHYVNDSSASTNSVLNMLMLHFIKWLRDLSCLSSSCFPSSFWHLDPLYKFSSPAASSLLDFHWSSPGQLHHLSLHVSTFWSHNNIHLHQLPWHHILAPVNHHNSIIGSYCRFHHSWHVVIPGHNYNVCPQPTTESSI